MLTGRKPEKGRSGTAFYFEDSAWYPLLEPGLAEHAWPYLLGSAALTRGSLPPQCVRALRDIDYFVQYASNLTLRSYQRQVAQAVVASVMKQQGRSFVVMFPRQSGKNELQAQIEAYLLLWFSRVGGEMLKVSPTWKPQSLNAMRRLERVLSGNRFTCRAWHKEQGYIYRIGRARVYFLSGQGTSHVVGATASTLLACDEAQDVSIAKWDKELAPMAASTNATRVFWGTAWTSQTLLARELRAARQAELQDGERRTWVLTADEVGAEVEAYRIFVGSQVAKLGRDHPLVKTQYFSEEIDAQAGMFPPARRALMQGAHPALDAPQEGKVYALTVDVAGEDEGAIDASEAAQRSGLRNPRRDSTALTVFEVDLATLEDEVLKAPTYRVVQRHEWVGVKHSTLYGRIKGLAEHWHARTLVVDATGIGAGMCSFLEKALPGGHGKPRVLPFVFSARSKSDLGWKFLAVVETGRYKEYKANHSDKENTEKSLIQGRLWRQVEMAQSEVLDGPQRTLRWGVPEGTRDSLTGEAVHDDLLISAALCAVLDGQTWGVAASAIIEQKPLFSEMREVY